MIPSSLIPTLPLLFIDSAVEDRQLLINALSCESKVFVLHPKQDGVRQITRTLVRYHESVQSVGIISHGAPGKLYLGNTELSHATLDFYRKNLIKAFHPGIELNLYACNVGMGESGKEFLARLRDITEVCIAASTTPLGNATKGGNWDLDVRDYGPEKDELFQRGQLECYPGILAPELNIEKEVETSTTSGTFVEADVADSSAPDVIGGETITYRATIQHSINSTAAAHDIVIADLLSDPNLMLLEGSVRVFLNGNLIADNSLTDNRVTIDSGNSVGENAIQVTYVGFAEKQ